MEPLITKKLNLNAVNKNNQDESKKTQKGLVPNVVGMGLIDATYMLEKFGLFVQPVGSGIVREQSIKAGLRINKGQKIILQLG